MYQNQQVGRKAFRLVGENVFTLSLGLTDRGKGLRRFRVDNEQGQIAVEAGDVLGFVDETGSGVVVHGQGSSEVWPESMDVVAVSTSPLALEE